MIVLHDCDTIELFFGIYMVVYETPGHCPSCLTYAVDNLVFTGDSYIPGVKVVTKLPQEDLTVADKSIERILKLAKDRIICPGHGEFLSK